MLSSNTARNLIVPHMPVVCSENGQFAVVDHLEGTDKIKLARDAEGQHHYIPLAWVTSVDDKVQIDRPGEQAMQEWSTTPDAVTASDAAEASGGVEVSPELEGFAPGADTVADAPRPHVNSVDATMGQPLVARVMTRKGELEAICDALPAEDTRTRGEIELALVAINGLLTGDLEHVPAVVAAGMNRWLELNKHVAELPAVAPTAPTASS